MKNMTTILSLLLLSSTTFAQTNAAAQGEYLAAKSPQVTAAVKAIASSRQDIGFGAQCDLAPEKATFPNGLGSDNSITVRFSCTTGTGYTEYVDVKGFLSDDGTSVSIESAGVVYTSIK